METAPNTDKPVKHWQFKPGQVANPNGRGKGVRSKITLLLKDAILEAASRAGGSNDHAGLVAYLQAQAIENPGPFMGLLGKILPMKIEGDDGKPLLFRVVYETRPAPAVPLVDVTPAIEHEPAAQGDG